MFHAFLHSEWRPLGGGRHRPDCLIRVHCGADLACLTRCGERWRGAAADGLTALGIKIHG